MGEAAQTCEVILSGSQSLDYLSLLSLPAPGDEVDLPPWRSLSSHIPAFQAPSSEHKHCPTDWVLPEGFHKPAPIREPKPRAAALCSWFLYREGRGKFPVPGQLRRSHSSTRSASCSLKTQQFPSRGNPRAKAGLARTSLRMLLRF